jgi:Fe-S cluster biogenesis protein NfuA
MREEIEKILKEEVNPVLAMHGGGAELVDVTDGIVKIKLTGGCAGCPMSQMTLASVVEEAIKAKLPAVKKVEAV